MSSIDHSEVPPTVRSVVRRYCRLERFSAWLVAALAGITAGAAIVVLPFVVGLLVAVCVLAALRVPVYHRQSAARLTTDADPAAVAAEFAGPTPPPLVFQWGVADEIRSTDGAGPTSFRTCSGSGRRR